MKRHPVLSGDRVTLRPIELEDAPSMLKSLCEPDVSHWTGNQVIYSLEQIQAHCANIVEDEDRLDYAIAQKGDHQYIGEAVLQEIDWINQHAHFRVALASPQWFGQGFGREATLLLLAHGFETLQLHRIELEVYEYNHRALSLYIKIGFVQEGVRRGVLLKDGSFHDAIVMSMLCQEYRERYLSGAE